MLHQLYLKNGCTYVNDISVFGLVSGPNNRINVKKFEKPRKQISGGEKNTRSISLELIFTWLEEYIYTHIYMNINEIRKAC